MPAEPAVKRTIAFIDGQNLFHAAREAFGYTYPNYDVRALAQAVCASKGWQLVQARFYTGVPNSSDAPFWSKFWSGKLAVMGRQRVQVFSRPLRYRKKKVKLPDGSEHSFLVGEEKGIDVRLALDVIRLGHRRDYDVALVFSQDQDLSEAAAEVRVIAREQDRWIKIASAFPHSPIARNRRGIGKTDWFASTGRSTNPVLTVATTGQRASEPEERDLEATTPDARGLAPRCRDPCRAHSDTRQCQRTGTAHRSRRWRVGGRLRGGGRLMGRPS